MLFSHLVVCNYLNVMASFCEVKIRETFTGMQSVNLFQLQSSVVKAEWALTTAGHHMGT
jgi:hypothetical protein